MAVRQLVATSPSAQRLGWGCRLHRDLTPSAMLQVVGAGFEACGRPRASELVAEVLDRCVVRAAPPAMTAVRLPPVPGPHGLALGVGLDDGDVRSYATPRVSATIWAMVVSMLWPCDVVLRWAVTSARLGSMRTVVAASDARVGCSHRRRLDVHAAHPHAHQAALGPSRFLLGLRNAVVGRASPCAWLERLERGDLLEHLTSRPP